MGKFFNSAPPQIHARSQIAQSVWTAVIHHRFSDGVTRNSGTKRR
jgi:hypothetical protein